MTNRIDDRHAAALETLLEGVPDVEWALTGSTGFALQGVPADPGDIDVQTDRSGAYAIERAFDDSVVDPVEHVERSRMQSHLGRLDLSGVTVDIMGSVRKRREDGTWDEPVDVVDHREFVNWQGYRVPVLSLAYEADAYDRLGRPERAAQLREYSNGDDE